MNTSKITSLGILVVILAAIISPGAAAEVNNTSVFIDPGDQAYVQFEIWVCLFATTILFLILSIILPRCNDICAVLAVLFSSVVAYTSLSLEFFDAVVVSDTVVQIHYLAHHSWLALLMLGVFLVCLINVFRVAFELYWTKPTGGEI